MKAGSKRLKGLWISDLACPTGFARVSHGVLDYVTKKHDIVGIGVNYKGDPHNYNFPIFPAFLGGDIYGAKRVVDLINSSEFDYIFMLNDAWVINLYLKTIKGTIKKKLPKIFVYFPVDAEYHDPDWYENFDIVTKAFTYTDFGKAVVKGAAPDLDIGVIPHGTNSEMFYKKFKTKSEAKVHLLSEQASLLGDPKDLFIVLNANRNQPRKRLNVTMEGFSKFAADKPANVKLYMHCGIKDASINVSKLSERYDINDRLIVTSLATGVQNVTIEHLNDIYNACDIGINTSLGEGWGLTNTEHAFTEAAQVVPNHSACAEIFHDCGLLMDISLPYTLDDSMTVGGLVSSDEVANKLQILYDNRELLDSLGKKAAEKLGRPEYQWETIANQWMKYFEDGVNSDSSLARNDSN